MWLIYIITNETRNIWEDTCLIYEFDALVILTDVMLDVGIQ